MALRIHLLDAFDLDVVDPSSEVIALTKLVDLPVRPLELVNARWHLELAVEPRVAQRDAGPQRLLHAVYLEPEDSIQNALILLLGRLVVEGNRASVADEGVLVRQLELNLLLRGFTLHA